MPSRKQPPSGPTSKPDAASSKKQKKHSDVMIKMVVLGNQQMVPLYCSHYPVELVGKEVERLFVCEYCFKYTNDVSKMVGHLKFCEPAHGGELAGSLEYKIDDTYSIYKVDGATDPLFCTNMCLYAKLYMNDKSIYYEVKGFVFYTLVQTIPSTSQGVPTLHRVVGFFSKEKMSWDDYNLACILVFQPFQRRGLGTKLISYSYRLSKLEGKAGSPEKPLSALGQIGYERYWANIVTGVILNPSPDRATKTLTIAEISRITMIHVDDITAILKKMNAIVKCADESTVLSVSRILDYVRDNGLRPSTFIKERDGFWYE